MLVVLEAVSSSGVTSRSFFSSGSRVGGIVLMILTTLVAFVGTAVGLF